jgi:hypothetical protein
MWALIPTSISMWLYHSIQPLWWLTVESLKLRLRMVMLTHLKDFFNSSWEVKVPCQHSLLRSPMSLTLMVLLFLSSAGRGLVVTTHFKSF